MRVLASADVHGMRPIYDWLLAVARERHVEAIVLAGDLLGCLDGFERWVTRRSSDRHAFAQIGGCGMPNGRSGGFLIETAALKRLVSTVSDTTAIGQVVGGPPKPRFRRADAAEVARLLEECPHEQVAVEEQDYQYYVIHLRNTPTVVWLVVLSESPIFVELRQRHAQWKIEHPNWTGWTGF